MTDCDVLKMVTSLMVFYPLLLVYLHPASVEAGAATRSSLYRLDTSATTNPLPDSIRSLTTTSRTECLTQCVGVDPCTWVVYCAADDVCYLMAATSLPVSVPNDTCQVFVEEEAGAEATTPTPCENGGSQPSVGHACSCSSSFTGTRCETRIEDCTDVSLYIGNSSGTHTVWPTNSEQPFDLECQGNTTMIMIRDRTISGCEAVPGIPVTYLDVPWADYEAGFNHSNCYMWLGLEKMHALSSVRPYTLYISLKTFDATQGQVAYNAFFVGDEASEYELSVSGFTGDVTFGDRFNLGDAATTLNGSHFCAKDHCNNSVNPCAEWHGGAWWNRLDVCQTNPHHRYDIIWVLADGTPHECKSIHMIIVPA